MTSPFAPASPFALQTETLRASYDDTPYPSLSYPQTHPDTLATIAMLAGMSPAPVARCRVLELGCASGGNLLPMADALPESRFVGVDLSERQVAVGQHLVRALNLNNVRLIAADLLSLNPEVGQFDYIIAHGLFSWVPRNVQDKVLEVCRDLLAPQGVAFISYNANPGWKLLGVIRDMLLFHTRQEADPRRRVALAREMMDFMHGALAEHDGAHGMLVAAYHRFLQRELRHGRELSDAYLLHDELDVINQPFYLHEFVERARTFGLQYLADADLRAGSLPGFPDAVAEPIRELSPDPLVREQYQDFLANRMFRRTLLCRADLPLQRTVTSDRLERFYLTTTAERDRATGGAPGVGRFVASDGSAYATEHPLTIAAFEEMRALAPRTIPMQELLERARARTTADRPQRNDEEDVVLLGSHLLSAFAQSADLVSLHAFCPNIATRVSAMPVALPYARARAQSDPVVANAFHVRVILTPLAVAVLPLLDGTHTRDDVVNALLPRMATDGLFLLAPAVPSRDGEDALRRQLASEVSVCLQWLADAALLIA